MRNRPNRFATGELEAIVLQKVRDHPGLYGSTLSDLIFSDPRSEGRHNRTIVLNCLRVLRRKGLVDRVETKVPSPHGRRIAYLVYPARAIRSDARV